MNNEQIKKLEKAFKLIKEVNDYIDENTIGAFQMTNGQFDAFMKATDSLIYARSYARKAIESIKEYQEA